MSLEPKLRLWQFPRYWRFNKWYHGGYQLICPLPRHSNRRTPWMLEDTRTGVLELLVVLDVQVHQLVCECCKGDWHTRLQKNPQLILQFAIMIQLTSRRILRDQDQAPKGMFYTIYWVCILSVRVSVIRVILVYLSITLVILEQAQAALEYHFAVQGWRQSYPLTSTCNLCLQTKPWRYSPVGELQPLSIPDEWWDMLSINFVVKLLESSGHDTIITVVNSVHKRIHFVPMHTMVTAEGAARLFLYYVWKLHGLPKRVVLNCRPQFMALFTKELYRLLGIRLSSSIAWHPQTDRQTEHINQELDQFLCLFVNE